MNDVIDFLRAQMDEDERIARAVPSYLGGPWMVGVKQGYCGDDFRITSASGQDVVGPGYEGGGAWGEEVRDHIARQDPERVIRKVEAMRQIIELCATETDETGGKPLAVRTLRLLASEYDDRPGYQESWRP